MYHVVSFITIYFVFVYTGWKIDDRILNVLTVTLPPLEKLTTIEWVNFLKSYCLVIIFVNLCLMEKDVFNHIVSSYVLMESKILFTQEKGSNPNVQTPTLPSFYCNSFRCQCGWHHATWKWYTLLNWCLICTFK